jgi:hypothetical protein
VTQAQFGQAKRLPNQNATVPLLTTVILVVRVLSGNATPLSRPETIRYVRRFVTTHACFHELLVSKYIEKNNVSLSKIWHNRCRGIRENPGEEMNIGSPSAILEESALEPTCEVVSGNNGSSAITLYVQHISILIFLLLYGFYLLVLIAPYGGAGLFKDPDIFWHVAVGRDIWHSGTFPQFDTYSYTFQGQPWIANEWLGDVLFYGAYATAGWRGIVLLSACVLALTYALLFLVLSRKMRLTVAIGLATAAYIFSIDQFNLRPYVFTYPLIILWVTGLLRALETDSAPSLMLLPIMTLWANIHGSFTFGLAIGAAFAAEAISTSTPGLRLRTARRWAIFLIAALCSACVTPYGYRSMLPTFQVFFGNDALNYIPEWQPLMLESTTPNNLILFGLIFLTMYYGVRVSFWRLITTTALIYLMFAHMRFTALFAIVTPLLLLTPVISQFPFLRLENQLATQRQFLVHMAGVSRRSLLPLGALIVGGVAAFGAYGPDISTRPNMTPSGAVDYIKREHLTGNIYNFYAFGGYLIFRGVKTFVDGRSDQLFGNGFLTRLVKTTRELPKNFLSLLAEYRVSIALVVPDSIEAQELERSADWAKVYSDRISVLFRKRDF